MGNLALSTGQLGVYFHIAIGFGNDKDAVLLHPCCPSGSEPHMAIDTRTGVPSGLFLPIYMHNEAVSSLYINIRCNIK